MDATKVEAMLQEAKVNRSDSHALFRHLNQFFCASFFESEKKVVKPLLGKSLLLYKMFIRFQIKPELNIGIKCLTHCCSTLLTSFYQEKF
jgi:hypothetical protein